MSGVSRRGVQLTALLIAMALCGGRGWVSSAAESGDREPARDAIPVTPAAVERWELDAGTTVMLIRDSRTPLVQLSIHLPVGTWSPWTRKHHAEEAFTSQTHDSAGVLDRTADERSVGISAYMDRWSSVIRLKFLKDDLRGALELLQTTLHNRDYDHGALVRSKWARGPLWTAQQKEPHFVLRQAGKRRFFAKGDARRSDYEEPESIATDVTKLVQTRDAMLRLPGRLIALVGDLSREEATQLCAALLPPVTPVLPEPPLAARFLPPTGQWQDTTLKLAKLTQVYFHYSRPGLGIADPDFAKLMVANVVLGGMHMNSRLFAALRMADGDTYTPYTMLSIERHPDLYSLVAYTRTANAQGIERKLRDVLRRLHQDGITEEEHRDAVHHLVGSYQRDYQQPQEQLALAVWEWTHGLAPGFYAQLLEAVKVSSRAEINDFIRRFYDPAQFALFQVGP